MPRYQTIGPEFDACCVQNMHGVSFDYTAVSISHLNAESASFLFHYILWGTVIDLEVDLEAACISICAGGRGIQHL